MHIAICDDNIADRKQLERLIKRESDKRAEASGILFTASFGNADSLLANPMQYDAFYIDVCLTEGLTGLDVAKALIAKGVNAPIVLCCSAINYRELFTEGNTAGEKQSANETHSVVSLPSNVFFLDKPIKVAELSGSIDHALQILDKAEPLIELREDKETFYVTEPDILYAVEDNRYVVVSLIDGRKICVTTTALNLFSQVESFPSFLAPSVKVVINCRYIQKLGFRKAVMTDGTVFKIHRECMPYAKSAFAQYRQ